MKTECCLVKDLLPLYSENMVSDETAALVAEHLNECADCAAEAQRLRTPTEENAPEPASDEAAPLRRVKKELKKRKIAAALLAAAIVFVAMFTIFSYLTRPNYVPYEESGVKVSVSEDGAMSVSFSEEATSCRIDTFRDPDDGTPAIEIEAWSSVWDRILGKKAGTVLLPAPENGEIARVLYCDCAKQGDLIPIFGGEWKNGGAVVLPRLFLGPFFLIALALAAAAGLARFLLRKKGKAARIAEYVLFAPLSYLAAHLILGAPFVTYAAGREFVMICIAAAGVYLALAAGRMRKF